MANPGRAARGGRPREQLLPPRGPTSNRTPTNRSLTPTHHGEEREHTPGARYREGTSGAYRGASLGRRTGEHPRAAYRDAPGGMANDNSTSAYRFVELGADQVLHGAEHVAGVPVRRRRVATRRGTPASRSPPRDEYRRPRTGDAQRPAMSDAHRSLPAAGRRDRPHREPPPAYRSTWWRRGMYLYPAITGASPGTSAAWSGGGPWLPPWWPADEGPGRRGPRCPTGPRLGELVPGAVGEPLGEETPLSLGIARRPGHPFGNPVAGVEGEAVPEHPRRGVRGSHCSSSNRFRDVLQQVRVRGRRTGMPPGRHTGMPSGRPSRGAEESMTGDCSGLNSSPRGPGACSAPSSSRPPGAVAVPCAVLGPSCREPGELQLLEGIDGPVPRGQ
jgi:hypothetical protein